MYRIAKSLLLVVFIMLAAALPVLAQDASLPDTIQVNAPGLFPEGIEWDANGNRFLLGSLAGNGVIAVTDDGAITQFATEENRLSSVGLHIDEATNRLLVDYSDASVFSDPDALGTASLGIYDLETADLIQFVDLSALYDGKHFANDLTVDADGNAYITDSFSPVIYKVTPEGDASVFVEDENLGDSNFGLNGIDYHPDGFLLASVAGSASLWKIPVDDPAAMSQVELSEPFGADGMILDENGSLIAVAQVNGSASQELISVSSADGWQTAIIDQRVPTEGATTAAIRDGAVYVTYAQLDQMGSNPPPDIFEIGRVDFPAS